MEGDRPKAYDVMLFDNGAPSQFARIVGEYSRGPRASSRSRPSATFVYAIRLGNGALSWATATVHFAVTGAANHAPVITSSAGSATGTVDATAGVSDSAAIVWVGGTISNADADVSDKHPMVKSGPAFTCSGGALAAGHAGCASTRRIGW